MKVINIEGFSNLEMVQREVDILDTLKNKQNSNIVKIYHISRKDKKCFIFMEKCISGNLKQFQTKINRGGQIQTMNQIVGILKEIINGYHILHTNSIIHRDLKPENLLIGNDANIKISDYGLGKIITDIDALQQHSLVGTPVYAAPQILAGTKYSAKCDVYSLGVIMYEIIFKQHPIKANSLMALRRNLDKLKSSPLVIPPIILQGDDKDRFKLESFLKNSIVYSENFRLSWDSLFLEYLNISQPIIQQPSDQPKGNCSRFRAVSTQQQQQPKEDLKNLQHEMTHYKKQTYKVYPVENLLESIDKNLNKPKPQERPKSPAPQIDPKVVQDGKIIKIIENKLPEKKNPAIKEEKQQEQPFKQVQQHEYPLIQEIKKEIPLNKLLPQGKIIIKELPHKLDQQERPVSSKKPFKQVDEEKISNDQKHIISPKKNFGLLKKKLLAQPNSYKVFQLVEVILAKYNLVKGFLSLFEKYKLKNPLLIINVDYSIMRIYLLGYQYSILLNAHDLIFDPNAPQELILLKQILEQKSLILDTSNYVNSQDQKIFEQTQKIFKLVVDQQRLMNSFKNTLLEQLSKLQENPDTQALKNLLKQENIYYNYLRFLHEFKTKFANWKKTYKQQQYDIETLQIIAYAIKICLLEKEYLMQDFEKIEPSTIMYVNLEEKVLEQYINYNLF